MFRNNSRSSIGTKRLMSASTLIYLTLGLFVVGYYMNRGPKPAAEVRFTPTSRF